MGGVIGLLLNKTPFVKERYTNEHSSWPTFLSRHILYTLIINYHTHFKVHNPTMWSKPKPQKQSLAVCSMTYLLHDKLQTKFRIANKITRTFYSLSKHAIKWNRICFFFGTFIRSSLIGKLESAKTRKETKIKARNIGRASDRGAQYFN